MYPSQNLTLMTDLYQLTMMQGYYTYHKTSQRVVFDLFYRENPFHGAFAIAAGLEQAIDYIRHLSFSREDIEYLRSLGIFQEDFLCSQLLLLLLNIFLLKACCFHRRVFQVFLRF